MDFKRIFELLQYQEAKYPRKKSLCFYSRNGNRHYHTSALVERIELLSRVLLAKGYEKGDILGLYCKSGSPEWNIVDLAAMQIGMVTVAIHENYRDEELQYVLHEIDARACFVSDEKMGEKLLSLGYDGFIFCLDSSSFPLLEQFYQEPKADQEKLVQRKAEIKENDLATIVYTSGSTGMPKGVMLSHYNIISNVKSCLSLVPINYRSVVVSFLPLGHIFERWVNYISIVTGASVWYVEDRKYLLKAMQEISPDYISCVPKVLEKNYELIQQQVSKRPFFIRQMLVWAMSAGISYSGRFRWSPVYLVKTLLAKLLLYRKWRRMLGGRLKYVGVGGAALNPELGKMYSAAGIQIREGYGMTECSPIISFNRFEPGGVEFGTVGIPIPGVEIKIASPDEQGIGEILVKGPNVMMGYFKNPGLTTSVMENGWLHTGDLGKFVHKRFLKIAGRKKNMFKTTSGRYIVPEKIENLLNADSYIDQSFVVGDAKAYVACLIVPEFSILKEWALKQQVHWTAPQYMVLNPKVEKFYQQKIDLINRELKTEEQIRAYFLIHDNWNTSSGELTSTLKIKRKVLKEKYAKQLEKLYAG